MATWGEIKKKNSSHGVSYRGGCFGILTQRKKKKERARELYPSASTPSPVRRRSSRRPKVNGASQICRENEHSDRKKKKKQASYCDRGTKHHNRKIENPFRSQNSAKTLAVPQRITQSGERVKSGGRKKNEPQDGL